jgi:hypothetical protein
VPSLVDHDGAEASTLTTKQRDRYRGAIIAIGSE